MYDTWYRRTNPPRCAQIVFLRSLNHKRKRRSHHDTCKCSCHIDLIPFVAQSVLIPERLMDYAKISVLLVLPFRFIHSYFPMLSPLLLWSDHLANGDAGASGEHSGGDIHRCQLLEEQLRSVRDMDLRDLRFVFARTTLEGLDFDFGNRSHEPADVTDVDSESIRYFE